MRNTAEIALETNIGFVTTDLHAKYSRYRVENEHRVCNNLFTYEIPQTSHWALGTNLGFVTADLRRNTAQIALGTNIGFVTTDLHLKYRRNLIGNEHRVCNH